MLASDVTLQEPWQAGKKKIRGREKNNFKYSSRKSKQNCTQDSP